jgi:hypothetical protein
LLILKEQALRADRFHARPYHANHNVGSGQLRLASPFQVQEKEAASGSFCQLIFLLLRRKSRHGFDPT